MITKELKKELYAKYAEVLGVISWENRDDKNEWQPDTSVSLSMLIHEYFAVKGLRGRTHKYKGVPENFDWETFGEDIQPLIEREENI